MRLPVLLPRVQGTEVTSEATFGEVAAAGPTRRGKAGRVEKVQRRSQRPAAALAKAATAAMVLDGRSSFSEELSEELSEDISELSESDEEEEEGECLVLLGLLSPGSTHHLTSIARVVTADARAKTTAGGKGKPKAGRR